jgi:GT2 family glycosyltransferase
LLKKLVVHTDPANSIKRLSKYQVFHDVREDHYARYDDRIDSLPAPWYYFWTCHLSIARRDLIKVGFFDENYDGRWGVEDNDLGFRLHQAGVSICLLRTALSIHYPHGKNKVERQLEGYQNCIYFHNKFKTLETRLFLDHYRDLGTSLADINAMSLKLSRNPIAV